MPTDGGNLIVEEEDRERFIAKNPAAKKYLRPLLWLRRVSLLYSALVSLADGRTARDIRTIPGISRRVKAVRDFRLKVPQKGTDPAHGRAANFVR